MIRAHVSSLVIATWGLISYTLYCFATYRITLKLNYVNQKITTINHINMETKVKVTKFKRGNWKSIEWKCHCIDL